MGILSTREWATVIWAFIFFVYAMVHRQIREAFWKVVKIFFGKKLRILWGIILLYVFFKERTKGGLNKRATIGAPLFSTLLVFPN